jgi:hypothetical protein
MVEDKKPAHSPLAEAVQQSVEEFVKKKSGLTFSKDSDWTEKNIIEYDSRMRIFGMEKFNGGAYISSVNFYRNEEDKKANKCCGALIMFVDEENATKILRSFSYKIKSDDDEDQILDSLADLCLKFTEGFKEELSKFGVVNPVISLPSKHRNDASEGVAFPYQIYKYVENNFYMFKQKAFVVNTVMALSSKNA